MVKQISIKDLARIANVSHSTVSRALSNSTLVNRETAERIWKLAHENRYRASLIARSLVTRQTKTIGCVVTNIADPFVGEVVSGIEEVANQHDYCVFLANSNADPKREIQVVRSFHERQVDGVLVAASRVGALYIPHLSELQIPIVLINNQHPGEYVYSVVIDNLGAARQMVKHLVDLGHKRIAYIGDRFGYQSDMERLSGYRQILEEADIPYHPELVVHGDSKPEGGISAMASLLSLSRRPTAVFCYNDLTALGVLAAMRLSGLKAPHDISVAGFDDLFLASYTEPPLTTIRQPMRAMGSLAMEIFLGLLSGNASERNSRISGELIVRESTAPPRP